MNDDQNKHWVLMGLITIGFIILSIFVVDLSAYSFIGAIFMAGFLMYLKFIDKMPDFEFKDYDVELSDKLMFNAVKNNHGEIKGIYLTGEDVFQMKKIGDCIGYFTYSFDVAKEKFKTVKDDAGRDKLIEDLTGKKTTKEIYCFYYPIYDGNFLIRWGQKVVPKIPIINKLIRMIPFFNQFFFPMYKGVLTNEDRLVFKRDIVEIHGKSLIPLSVKTGFNTYDVIEYKGKFEETRKMERYLFVKEINSDLLLQLTNIMKNSVEASAKMNPKVNLTKEESVMKTR